MEAKENIDQNRYTVDSNKWNLNGTKEKVSAKPMPLLPEAGLPQYNKSMRGKRCSTFQKLHSTGVPITQNHLQITD